MAKADKAEAAESVAKAKLAALQEGNESLMTQALEQLKQQLTEDFDAKKKHELKSFEAKEQELQNEVRTKQKTVDDLREKIEQAKGDDSKGERVRELEKELKKTELELGIANALHARVEKEFKEASCSHPLLLRVPSHHTPHSHKHHHFHLQFSRSSQVKDKADQREAEEPRTHTDEDIDFTSSNSVRPGHAYQGTWRERMLSSRDAAEAIHMRNVGLARLLHGSSESSQPTLPGPTD